MPLHALLEGPTTTGIASDAPRAFRRLFGTRLSTLEREINQAAAQGFRVTAAMGGDVLLERSEDATVKHAYRLVAAGGLPTLVRDVRQAGREGYRVVPATFLGPFRRVRVCLPRRQGGAGSAHDRV